MFISRTTSPRNLLIIALLAIVSIFGFTGSALACEEESCGDKGNWTDPNGVQGGGDTGLFIDWLLATEGDNDTDPES